MLREIDFFEKVAEIVSLVSHFWRLVT